MFQFGRQTALLFREDRRSLLEFSEFRGLLGPSLHARLAFVFQFGGQTGRLPFEDLDLLLEFGDLRHSFRARLAVAFQFCRQTELLILEKLRPLLDDLQRARQFLSGVQGPHEGRDLIQSAIHPTA
ncbi:hypothetical protein D3C72_1457190 [compost metagenome]